jgi:hypothetical protein
MKFRRIEILEKDSNKKGDLFGRLMADLFHTLGYDEPRLNIHKSGREVDVFANHRTEAKIAIAECKAHVDTIGGADINKFIGVIDAEKRKIKKEKGSKTPTVVGYYISLSGFKETAIEQENDFDNKRVILIRPEKLVEELVTGRILVSITKAISSLSLKKQKLTLIDHYDLLAYNKGWVWVLYYSNTDGQSPSHFTFVHAEGKPLIKDLSDEIIAIDNSSNSIFSTLKLINIEDVEQHAEIIDANTKGKYFKYLENELGEIQFEGLPTDKEAGSVKVKLESIFVPLHLTQGQRKNEGPIRREKSREGIGKILSTRSRLAILAKPGGGKSTLLKRIAIAYAFPERRRQINDELPDKDWFPIFLRCRELGEKVTLSITDIINSIPARAELHSCLNSFSILVSRALQNGSALILIDGLDEIAEDKNRIAFVNQLRTFIATFPTINIIVTSREAGFRVVGGSLATYCENFTVSNLINSEIHELSLKWHKAIIDDSDNTIREANKLSDLIIKDKRIKVLAENPLLLTTLLFVKRWAGYLPTKRSVLYQEMIKLLLVTWNVEGHEILEIEEAEPQLAFVAYWMSKRGQQTISADELSNCLIEARKQMPEILGYTNVSPSEFIKRVESRSSLLIMSGHKRLDSGNVTAVYEFLHLSFQEYLTAKAIVKKYIPQPDAYDTVVDILKPNINNENWKEVIPLTAVLLERDTKELISHLIAESKRTISRQKSQQTKANSASSLLGNCLANEIQISPDLLNNAIEWFAKAAPFPGRKVSIEIILKNKFRNTFKKRIKECILGTYEDKFFFLLGDTIGDIFLDDFNNIENNESIEIYVLRQLGLASKENQCCAILGMMGYAYSICWPKDGESNSKVNTEKVFAKLFELFRLKDNHINFSICWCIVWSSDASIFPEDLRIKYAPHLIKLWMKPAGSNFQRVSAWAITRILTPDMPTESIKKIVGLKKVVQSNYDNPLNEFDKLVAIFLGILLGFNETSKEPLTYLKNKLKQSTEGLNKSAIIQSFLTKMEIKKSSKVKIIQILIRTINFNHLFIPDCFVLNAPQLVREKLLGLRQFFLLWIKIFVCVN